MSSANIYVGSARLRMIAGVVVLILCVPAAQAGTVAHYSFESDLTDSGANSLDLNTSSGAAAYATGQFGQAVDLDGSNWHYNASTLFDFGTGDFAVAFWYQSDHVLPDGPFNNGQMVTKANHSSGAAGWGINQTSGTSPVIIAFDTDSGGFRHNEPAPADDNVTYHHVLMQRKGDFVESYMDGAPVGNLSGATGVSVSNATYAMAVGARGVLSDGTGGSFGLDGRIDELWLFDMSLSQAQIDNLISDNNPIPEPSSGLLVLLAASGLAFRNRTRRARG